MKYFFLLICTIFSLVSCNDQGTTEQQSTDSTSTAKQETVQQTSNSDSASSSVSCTTQIRKFLAWYKTNLNELDKINLVDLIGSGDTAQYRVNFTNTEKYIATLKNSGYFSDLYLQRTMNYFKENDSLLLKHKQNDGPPEGFDFDRILYTQEVDAELEHVQQSPIESVKPGLIRVNALEKNLLFSTSMHGDSCLIDDIQGELRE